MRALLMALLLTSTTAFATSVELTASDGTALHADELGRGQHAVILIHDQGRTLADWGLFAEKLQSKGYRVLSLDLRGHGESKEILTFSDEDWTAMTGDLQAAVKHVKNRGAKKISLVGAGLGANISIQVASQDKSFTSLVAISPGLNIRGYKPSVPITAMGELPVMLAAGQADRKAASTVKFLQTKIAGAKRAVLLDGESTGTNLIDEYPNLEDNILTWLAGNYGAQDGTTAGAITTGDVDKLESQGKRYGED
ncbi:MAG: alpha-beta hydrolase superfamily lysophospholipase [Kiritimatiellia bacterium]|jgi:alpha-beta hydrolase superfamily lysophospholipase